MSLKPDSPAPAWRATEAAVRVKDCATMLAVHGFLTTKERERVMARMMKWIAHHKVTK